MNSFFLIKIQQKRMHFQTGMCQLTADTPLKWNLKPHQTSCCMPQTVLNGYYSTVRTNISSFLKEVIISQKLTFDLKITIAKNYKSISTVVNLCDKSISVLFHLKACGRITRPISFKQSQILYTQFYQTLLFSSYIPTLLLCLPSPLSWHGDPL